MTKTIPTGKIKLSQLLSPRTYEKGKAKKRSVSDGSRQEREPTLRVYGQLMTRLQRESPELQKIPFDSIVVYPLDSEKKSPRKQVREAVYLGDVVDALDRSSGRVYLAARLLELRHSTLKAIINRSDAVGEFLREVIEGIEGELIDDIEMGLIKCCRNLEDWAIKFFLSSKAKSRGYGGTTSEAKATIIVGGDVPQNEYS